MSCFDLIREVTANRWENTRAWQWQAQRPWRVGCNFLPSTAINQLEMWQPETFDAETIDRELGWLAALGMNSVRVFLHDLLWVGDGRDFLERVEQYLTIADKHGITTLFVFFDSCWFPFPRAGRQREPEPGVHNSYWLQSPGVAVLNDAPAFARLEPYVTGVVRRFRNDVRVEGWDVWNEPENSNAYSYGARDLGAKKGEIVFPFIVQAFHWVRSAQPSQPVTSAVWLYLNGLSGSLLEQFQIEASDVISFHRYADVAGTLRTIKALQAYDRPLICTEYMARSVNSTFQDILPLFKQDRIGAYSWGAVSGKSQTIYPWDSWQKPSKLDPELWFHDVLRADGAAYCEAEVEAIRRLTSE